MKFAENNRISHRQLYRQMVLAFLAPFLLCLFGEGKTLGISGLLGTAAATVLLLFYVIFLIRLAPSQGDLIKTAGRLWGRLIGFLFLLYVILTAAYLVRLVETMVPRSLVTGVPGTLLSFLAVLVCSFGTHRGLQRRGRMAEVSGGLLLGSVVLMMLLSLGQAKLPYLREMYRDSVLDGPAFLEDGYRVLCAFSGIGLLPFALGDVEKNGSAGKAAGLGVLTLGGILLGMELLLPSVFGWKRLLSEEMPILPLLSGANLPGNVLSRFDVLWMAFLLYSLLFSVGSLFHYGHRIIGSARLGTGRVWMALLVFYLSAARFDGMGIENYYEIFLGYVFVPCLLLAQLYLFLRGRGRRKKKMAAAVLSACLFLGGCAGVEPEKRMYPLALGVDFGDGGYKVVYGMADLPKTTGQEKPEENGAQGLLTISGSSFGEIEAAYDQSQEKYLDLGHLQVLILGDGLIGGNHWQEALSYLKQEPFLGENVYVFQTADVSAALGWQGTQGSSVGQYLLGMLENRTYSQEKKGVTLRELYHGQYQWGSLPRLPQIVVREQELKVLWE